MVWGIYKFDDICERSSGASFGGCFSFASGFLVEVDMLVQTARFM